jgi:serine phosphatase RsbU (regulator of sigma subunit)
VPRALLRRFFAAGRAVVAGGEFAAGERSFIRSFLGPFARTDRRVFRQVQLAQPAPRERYVYLSQPTARGMFFVFIDTPDSLQEACVQDRIARLHRRYPGVRLVLLRADRATIQGMGRLGFSPKASRRVWAALTAAPTEVLRLPRSLVARRAIGPELWVVGRQRRPGVADPPLPWLIGLAGLLAGMLPLGWSSRFALLERSVRTSLVAAFLYAVAVPSLILALAVRVFLAEQRAALEDRVHREAEKALVTWDQQMLADHHRLRRRLERLAIRLGFARHPPLEAFRREWPSLRRLGMDSCLVFDRAGRVVFEEEGRGGQRNRLSGGRGADRLARAYLRFYGSRSTAASGADDSEPLGEVEALSSGLLDKPVALGFLEADDQRSVIALLPLLDAAWQAWYVAFIRWSRDRFEELYLRQELRPRRRGSTALRVQAFHVLDPTRRLPASAVVPGASAVLARLAEGQSLVRSRVVRGGEGFLLTGLRGVNITCFSLVAATSDRSIRAVLDELRARFLGAVLVLVLISLATSLSLARSFLRPVGRLTEGLQAIRERRFEHRIGIAAADEFGGLARLFDSMMESLADLEVARTIQEQFFPPAPLRCGRWEIAGVCRTASRVGGDVFDHFALADDRAFLFIGDVTGHGIGAALVTALAKATVRHPATMGRPEAVIAALREVMRATARVRQLMTCQAAVLDATTATLAIAGAGHPWPMLWRRGQAPRLLEVHGKIVGARFAAVEPATRLALEAGDVVVFYSDGVIEAIEAKTGRPLGVAGLQRHLPDLAGPTAGATAARLVDWVRVCSGRDIPEDDLTVLVIQGVASPEELR